MRRNPLWNLVFLVIMIIALLLARYYRVEKKRTLLSRYPLYSPAGVKVGEVSFWNEDSRKEILRIELWEKPPEPLYVVVYSSEGMGRSLGRMQGALFVHSLEPSLRSWRWAALKLQGVRSDRVYAEFHWEAPRGPTS
ncbi:MAG: hypothetical protein DSZ24_07525 [Thermodesulfatator sp.]|nr:MAG: hypothetical protein DSZ24_07525 [Thermodesulfatator sp.]